MNKLKKIKLDQDCLENQSQESPDITSQIFVSGYFSTPNHEHLSPVLDTDSHNSDISTQFFHCVHSLNEKLKTLHFSKPVEYIYNPTEYAFDVFKNYIQKYCTNAKTIMFLGMNPGPWGMSQTGVPFGEISSVRDWLQLDGEIGKPIKEVSSRPVMGFDCHRTEISGKRFWELVKELSDTPENFFSSSFVHNYCPLQLMTSSGRNITPTELQINERNALFQLCDVALLQTLKIYKISIVICIGKFAEARLNKILKSSNESPQIQVLSIPHPSPRTIGNNNWNEKTLALMKTLNLLHHFEKKP